MGIEKVELVDFYTPSVVLATFVHNVFPTRSYRYEDKLPDKPFHFKSLELNVLKGNLFEFDKENSEVIPYRIEDKTGKVLEERRNTEEAII